MATGRAFISPPISNLGVICSLLCALPSFLGYPRPDLPGFIRKLAAKQGHKSNVRASPNSLRLGREILRSICSCFPGRMGEEESRAMAETQREPSGPHLSLPTAYR